MSVKKLDVTGMKCPQPLLKIAAFAPNLNDGDILEVTGDCDTFEDDVRKWVKRMEKTILSIKDEGTDKQIIQIRF